MIARLLTLTAAAFLLAAAPASGAVSGDWGRYASEARSFAVPLPAVYVHRSGCPHEQHAARPACTNPSTGEVWIPDSDTARFTLAHELGHAFDGQVLTDADRSWFRRVMHAPAGPWWQPDGAGEWFADYYADCAVGNARISQEGYADRPTPRQLRRVCTAVRVLGLTR